MTGIVDVHAHVLPPTLVQSADRGDTRWGIDFERADGGRVMYRVSGSWRPLLQQDDVYGESPSERAARMLGIRVEVQVLSLSPSLLLYLEDENDAIRFCSDINDEVAAFVAEEPEHFRAFSILPLEHPLAAVSELERTMAQRGVVGSVVSTHVNGRDWDDPRLLPVLEAAEALGAALFVHPAAVRASDVLSRYHLRNLIGNPYETALAMASFVFGGILDRFPSLRLCFAHGGGYGAFGMGRLDHGWRVRPEPNSKLTPSEYLQRMWFDSLTHDELALRYLIDRAGADRIVLGSDDPADMGLARPVDWLDACTTLRDQERSLILGANAGGLLGARLG
ncbi:MAG: amidohydrolase [Actinomycetota bacterium]|nr:amidohydrolase [Actinomycetota bacterium]